MKNLKKKEDACFARPEKSKSVCFFLFCGETEQRPLGIPGEGIPGSRGWNSFNSTR